MRGACVVRAWCVRGACVRDACVVLAMRACVAWWRILHWIGWAAVTSANSPWTKEVDERVKKEVHMGERSERRERRRRGTKVIQHQDEKETRRAGPKFLLPRSSLVSPHLPSLFPFDLQWTSPQSP